MSRKQIKFLLAIALQVAVILAIIFYKLSILTDGTAILLKVEPVDPRDWLRGDYVTFQYNISNLHPSLVHRGQQAKNGEVVYVTLRQSGQYWLAEGIETTKPTAQKLFIEGRVESGGRDNYSERLLNQSLVKPDDPDLHLRIKYGIEDYFIPEGKGVDLPSGSHQFAARVMIDHGGNAVLKQLFLDGKPWP